MNLHRQNFYAYRFFCCEVLNFVNVIGQIFLMDFFFNGEFRTYGLDLLRFTEMEPEHRTDRMSKIFPKVTKYTFHKYVASGTLQKFDGLCVLLLNIVNKKIYVFLGIWFIILPVLSGLSLFYRTVTVVVAYLPHVAYIYAYIYVYRRRMKLTIS